LMDLDLTAILSELDPAHGREDFLFPGTKVHVLPQDQAPVDLKARIERLYDNVSDLPWKLYLDCWTVLQMSQGQYQTSRIIVWTSAVMVLGMLWGLTSLFNRWVLAPVRMLQRGVRHVAPGSVHHQINLASGGQIAD